MIAGPSRTRWGGRTPQRSSVALRRDACMCEQAMAAPPSTQSPLNSPHPGATLICHELYRTFSGQGLSSKSTSLSTFKT
eukprot:365554-Chlamydomonas_euryale.AAC.13